MKKYEVFLEKDKSIIVEADKVYSGSVVVFFLVTVDEKQVTVGHFLAEKILGYVDLEYKVEK